MLGAEVGKKYTYLTGSSMAHKAHTKRIGSTFVLDVKRVIPKTSIAVRLLRPNGTADTVWYADEQPRRISRMSTDVLLRSNLLATFPTPLR